MFRSTLFDPKHDLHINIYEIIKVIIIEFKQFPKFDPSIFHADVELDAKIFSSIEDYITELNIDELCLEDIFIQLLEGKKSLKRTVHKSGRSKKWTVCKSRRSAKVDGPRT